MYYKFNKYSLFYKKYGDSNKTILILPGWGNTRDTFRYIIDYFKNDYTIYILDYPGFGNSPIINKELTIYDYAFIIYSFIKDNNITNPILISHSFGGRISSILLGEYNLKVNKLILMDVAGIKRINIKVLIKQKIYKFLKFLTKIFPKKLRYKSRKTLLKIFSSTDYKALPPNMYKTFKNIVNENLKKYYKKIKTNTLIIWGDKDYDTPLKDAYLLSKIINNSKLIIFQNSTHFSYLENIEKTNKEIDNFIKIED